MMWRQQPESDIGFPRTTAISYAGEATTGPFEQYDLSGYCTSETHAVKVGAYRLARRKFITHTLRLRVRPANYNSLLTQGDIVRVRLRRETAVAALDYHDFLYEIERIEKTASGACVFDLTHFPIDAQGRSLVALEVAAATAPGVAIASGRSDYSCDDNSATLGIDVGIDGIDFPAFDDTPGLDDTTVDFDAPIDDEWATGGHSPVGPDVSPPAGEPSGGQTPIGSWDNPADPLESTLDQSGVGYITGGTGTGGVPKAGDTLSVADTDFTCAGQVCWSKINKDTGVETDISCQDQLISGAWSLSITTDEIDYYIVAVGRCKDPSTPDGWGPPQSLGQTAAVLDPNFAYPTGCWESNKDCLQLVRPAGGWLGGFAKFVSLENLGIPGPFGTTRWRATGMKLDGTLVTSELNRTQAEIDQYYLIVITTGQCAGAVCLDNR